MFGFLKKKRALDRDALKGLVDGLVQGQARVELHDTPERTVVILHVDPARGARLRNCVHRWRRLCGRSASMRKLF